MVSNMNEIDLSLIPIDANMEDCAIYDGYPNYNAYLYFGDCTTTVDEDNIWNATQMSNFILGCKIISPNYIENILGRIEDGQRSIMDGSDFAATIYDLNDENKLHDLSEIVCAIDEYQEILVIYISRKDTHYFFDCK